MHARHLKTRRVLCGAALVIASACGADMTSPPETEAQFAASETPNEPWLAQVVGGLIFIDDGLAEQDISTPHVSVTKYSDGSVRGAFKGGRFFVDPVFSDAQVVQFFNITQPLNAHCLAVDGNRAWIGIVDDGVKPFSPSGEFVFVVVAREDGLTGVAGAFVPAAECVAQPDPAFPFTTFGGNLRISER